MALRKREKKKKINVKQKSAEILSAESDEIYTVRIEAPSTAVLMGYSSLIGKRKYQQDAVKIADEYAYADMNRTIAILCDGMGGLNGGEKASNLCVEKMYNDFFSNDTNGQVPQFLSRMVKELDESVKALCNSDGRPLGAGTTLASVVIEDGMLYWVSVGDSRIYIMRNNQLTQVTTDHNYKMLLDRQAEKGLISREEAETHPKKEALISYIGIGGVEYININLKPFRLCSGDKIIICSDGLYRTLSDLEMVTIIDSSCDDMFLAATSLTECAVSKGYSYQDNTSAIVIRYAEPV